MYCNNCGKQIPDGAKFCRYCGASQAVVNNSAAAVNNSIVAGTPTYQNGAGTGTQETEYHYSYVKQQPVASSQPQPIPQPVASPQPQPIRQPVASPQPQPIRQPVASPQPQPIPAAVGSAFLISQKCSYKVAPESDLKKYEWGGIPEGTVDIYEDRLEFFKKSKVVKLAFGAIGSALSGKGKADIIVPGHLVLRDTVENKKNEFRFRLTDGRIVYVVFAAFSLQQDACNAMFRFLNI